MVRLPLPQSCKDCRGWGCLFDWGENDQFRFWWGFTTQAADTGHLASSQDARVRPAHLAAAQETKVDCTVSNNCRL